jgi:hypothetical protein
MCVYHITCCNKEAPNTMVLILLKPLRNKPRLKYINTCISNALHITCNSIHLWYLRFGLFSCLYGLYSRQTQYMHGCTLLHSSVQHALCNSVVIMQSTLICPQRYISVHGLHCPTPCVPCIHYNAGACLVCVTDTATWRFQEDVIINILLYFLV